LSEIKNKFKEITIKDIKNILSMNPYINFNYLKDLIDIFSTIYIKDIIYILNIKSQIDFSYLKDLKNIFPKISIKDIKDILNKNPNINFSHFKSLKSIFKDSSSDKIINFLNESLKLGIDISTLEKKEHILFNFSDKNLKFNFRYFIELTLYVFPNTSIYDIVNFLKKHPDFKLNRSDFYKNNLSFKKYKEIYNENPNFNFNYFRDLKSIFKNSSPDEIIIFLNENSKLKLNISDLDSNNKINFEKFKTILNKNPNFNFNYLNFLENIFKNSSSDEVINFLNKNPKLRIDYYDFNRSLKKFNKNFPQISIDNIKLLNSSEYKKYFSEYKV
jgi:hypothetical protein